MVVRKAHRAAPDGKAKASRNAGKRPCPLANKLPARRVWLYNGRSPFGHSGLGLSMTAAFAMETDRREKEEGVEVGAISLLPSV